MGIAVPISSLKTKMQTIQIVTPDQVTENLFVRVWNNQLEYLKSGEIEALPLPSAYIETIANQSPQGAIGQGVTAFDLMFRIHILHTHYNTEGSFEQDLDVFNLRDKVVRVLNRFAPGMCSMLDKIGEEMDYQHDNVYHYIIDYKCHFTDFTGSDQDTLTGQFTDSVPPLYLIINVNQGASYYNVNSTISSTSDPMCNTGTTQFFCKISFNKFMFFDNGTTIVLDITSNGSLITTDATGDGFTYNAGTKTVTITDVTIFRSIDLEVQAANILCASVRTCTVKVGSYTGLIHHGIAGTQQTLTQTYTP